MTHDLNKTCSTCYFWTGDKKHKEGDGACKRYPPQVAGMVPQQNPITREVRPAIISAWSSCAAAEWCGEWTGEKVVLQ